MCYVSETAHVELKSERVSAPAWKAQCDCMTKGVSKACISSRSRMMFSTWSSRMSFIFCITLR